MICSFQDFEKKTSQDRYFTLLVSMINSKHVHFYRRSFTLWTPPMHIFGGVRTPLNPWGIDAPGSEKHNQELDNIENIGVARIFDWGGAQTLKKSAVFTEIESEFWAEIPPKIRWSPKKIKNKKKGLHRNWEWFFSRNRKFEQFFRPKSGDLQKKKKKKKKKKGLHRNWEWFFGRNR